MDINFPRPQSAPSTKLQSKTPIQFTGHRLIEKRFSSHLIADKCDSQFINPAARFAIRIGEGMGKIESVEARRDFLTTV